MNIFHKILVALVSLGVIVIALAQIPADERPVVALPHLAIVRAQEPDAQVIFGGDMMFDRSVRQYAERLGEDHLLSCLTPVFAHADLVVANLEGPITGNPSVSVGSLPGDDHNYTFTFPLSTAALLKKHRIEAVALGNNHTLNFGVSGIASTTDALRSAQVGYFGDPYGDTVAHVSPRGIAIALIGFNEFAPGGWRAAATTTIMQIRSAREAEELPVVFAHWGDEYVPATPFQATLAHAFVDAGAVLVVGAHPHVVQEHETYRGVPIYYSLGNLIFDQYWNDAVSHGLLIDVAFDAHGVVGIREIPVVLNRDRQTCPRTE